MRILKPDRMSSGEFRIKSPTIHLINPMWDAYAGSEQRTLAIANILKADSDVKIWSQYEISEVLSSEVEILRMAPKRGLFPLGGILVFVGTYYHVGRWNWIAPAKRRIIISNTPERGQFQQFYRNVSMRGFRQIELVYASSSLRDMFGIPGVVMESPIDLGRFRAVARPPSDRFVVGRLSRNDPNKFHAGAAQLYARLAAHGARVRIMGGLATLFDALADLQNIELLAAGAEAAPDFLQGLDCFLYRTSDSWYETFGRVVFEAMACGVPVIAHRRGGYSEFLTHGEDALLFDDDEQAFTLVMGLKADPRLRRELGERGRRRVETMFGQAYFDKVRKFFLEGS